MNKMAIDLKSILRAGTAAQATALASHNIKLAMSKKKTPRRFIKTATTNIVGIPLLQTQSQLIGAI